MMSLSLNEKILKNILNDDEFITESKELIQNLIDKEFEKTDDDIDFDFIDECSRALIELNEGSENDFDKIIPFFSTKSFLTRVGTIGWKSLKKSFRASVVAAVILATTITANAAVGEVTGMGFIENIVSSISSSNENENSAPPVQETTTHRSIYNEVTQVEKTSEPATTENVETTYKSRIVFEEDNKPTTPLTTQPTTQKAEEPTTNSLTTTVDNSTIPISMDVVIVRSQFKSTYNIGEEFCTDGMYIIVTFQDQSRRTVNPQDCKINGFDSSQTGTKKVSIVYENLVYVIAVSVTDNQTTDNNEVTTNSETTTLIGEDN